MGSSDELADNLHVVLEQLVSAVPVAERLAPAELAVLGILEGHGPRTTAEVAERRGVGRHAAAGSVKELLDQELVRVEVHSTGERRLLLHLNESGRTRLNDHRRQRAAWLGAALDSELTAAEREDLGRCVELLARLSRTGPHA